ncbi:RNA polymerase sigma factor [Sphingobacteriales bacterium UPWRP_1]|nr:hypothetical protein BVG80_14110 [Sphingobacteriales bacterium TSM_CSM]PSJ77010.1 RNA polymerase sigma factor [Sphingobacteriales bacterium UPWRP_1]
MQSTRITETGKKKKTMPAKEWQHLPDKDLIQLIVTTGNTALFGELYDRYANKVFRKCISMVKHTEDAQDLAHDILVKAFLNLANFAGNSSFSTWIYAITYNRCIDFIRNKHKLLITETENERLPDASDEGDAGNISEKEIFEIEIDLLKRLLHELNEDDRAILLMKYQDDMSVEEIQQVLKLNSSAVKMRLKRARDRLRAMHNKHRLPE